VDIGLAVFDGIEVASRIHAVLGRRIFLVACTANERSSGGERAKGSQFDSWLVKPVALPDLLLWIRKAAAAAN
jgi:CheY-like chemotaxis protein